MIAHIDADSFFASVLIRKDPRLKGKPVLALGMGGGCVIAASYEAKAFGVKTGMPLKEALKLVPNAIRMPSDFRETGIASEQIERVLDDVCPVREQFSIDEWFLDLETCQGGVPLDLSVWAENLRATILKKTSLSMSIGVGSSKLLAKMASEYRKPGGITIVGCRDALPGRLYVDIQTFLRDRPAAAIPGIGRKRSIHTDSHGWKTAWDIATAPSDTLVHLFGRPGLELQKELLGERVSPVQSEVPPPKSLSRCRSFKPTRDENFIWAILLTHLQYTVLRLRKHGRACLGISVWLRDGEYEHYGDNLSLPQPLFTEESIQPCMRRLFNDIYERNMLYTQAGMALWHLVPFQARQGSLFIPPERMTREERLQSTLDTIREQYGRPAIQRASALPARDHSHKGFDVPMLGEAD